MPRKTSLNILAITIIFGASVASLTEFGNFGIAQGQGNLTTEQKAAMCDPNNPKLNFVNTTESHICGIPKTLTSPANTSLANTTTGSEAPGVVPSP
jgi:hypothetical protein